MKNSLHIGWFEQSAKASHDARKTFACVLAKTRELDLTSNVVIQYADAEQVIQGDVRVGQLDGFSLIFTVEFQYHTDVWAAWIALRLMRALAMAYPHARVAIWDEGSFLIPKRLFLENTLIIPDWKQLDLLEWQKQAEALNNGRSVGGVPITPVRDWMPSVFYARVNAFDHKDKPAIATLGLSEEQLKLQSLDDLENLIKFPWANHNRNL